MAETVETQEQVVNEILARGTGVAPNPLRFSVGTVIRYRYPRPSTLKRYGVTELRFEVVSVHPLSRLVALRKLYTKSGRTMDVHTACVNAWYDEISVDDGGTSR